MTSRILYAIIHALTKNNWVWRSLVARYLGVVEAAGSSPVTQTMLSVHNASELWTLSFYFNISLYVSRLFGLLFSVGIDGYALSKVRNPL